MKKHFEKKKIIFVFLLFGIILFSLNFASSRPLNCADNPTQLWHFEEGTGTNAEDSCFGYNATLYGDMNWTNGINGNAVEFNGINSYIDAGNIYPFNQNMPEFSFSLWVKVSNPNVIAWQTLFRSGYYNPATEFIEAIHINEGDNDYTLFMGSNSLGNCSVDNGEWHNIMGTFNGTSQSSKLYIDGNFIVETFLGYSEITATTSPLGFGYNFDNGFVLNGTLDEIAFFNRTLSQEEVLDFYNEYPHFNITRTIFSVPSYPYVDLNASYPIKYKILINNASTYVGNLHLNISEPDGNYSDFPLTWNSSSQSYEITLIFTEIGNYPFTISSLNPYINIFTGEFLVRVPFNVTFCAFNQNDNYASYENDYAYLIAEFTSSKKYYNDNLEQFITPLGFATTFKTPVFHTLYRNGCGTFKLYEANEEYVVRLFDGIATFQTTFSEPNISKTYGTNIYFGKYVFNGSDENFNVLLTNKDIKQYRWLFNWVYIILLGVALIGSIFMFFVIPEKPLLSLIFGLGFISMLTLVRIVLWIWQGW